MIDFYLWPTQAQAQAALDNINAHPAWPVQARNAATGDPVPGVFMTHWTLELTQVADGRWGFPRPSAAHLDNIGISESERAAWLAAFAPDIVTNPQLPSPPQE